MNKDYMHERPPEVGPQNVAELNTQPRVVILLDGGMERQRDRLQEKDRIKFEKWLKSLASDDPRRKRFEGHESGWIPTKLNHPDKDGVIAGLFRTQSVFELWKHATKGNEVDIVVCAGLGGKKMRRLHPIPDSEIPIESRVYNRVLNNKFRIAKMIEKDKKDAGEPYDAELLKRNPPLVATEEFSNATLRSAQELITIAREHDWDRLEIVSIRDHLTRARVLFTREFEKTYGRPPTQEEIIYTPSEDICLDYDPQKYTAIIDSFLNPDTNDEAYKRRKAEIRGVGNFLDGTYKQNEFGIDKLSLKEIKNSYLKAIHLLEDDEVKNQYLELLDSHDESVDPLGTLSLLLSLGKQLAPYFATVLEKPEKIFDAWDSFSDALDTDDDFAIADIESTVDSLKTTFALVYIEERTNNRLLNKQTPRGKRIIPEVVRRRMAILKYLAENPVGVTGGQLAKAVGASEPTISHELKTLGIELQQKASLEIAQRRATIFERLPKDDTTGIAFVPWGIGTQLVKELGVSTSTISLDIAALKKQGLIKNNKDDGSNLQRRTSPAVVQRRAAILNLLPRNDTTGIAFVPWGIGTQLVNELGVSAPTVSLDITALKQQGLIKNSKDENPIEKSRTQQRTRQDGEVESESRSLNYSGHTFTFFQERPDNSVAEIEAEIKRRKPQPQNDKEIKTRRRQLIFLYYTRMTEEIDRTYGKIAEATKTTDGTTASPKEIDHDLTWLKNKHLITRGTRGRKIKKTASDRETTIIELLALDSGITNRKLAERFGVSDPRMSRILADLKSRELIPQQDRSRKKDERKEEERERKKAQIKGLWLMGKKGQKMDKLTKCKSSRYIANLKQERSIIGVKPTESQVASIINGREAGIPSEEIIRRYSQTNLLHVETVREILLFPSMKYISEEPMEAIEFLTRRQYILVNQHASVKQLMDDLDASEDKIHEDLNFLRGLGFLTRVNNNTQ